MAANGKNGKGASSQAATWLQQLEGQRVYLQRELEQVEAMPLQATDGAQLEALATRRMALTEALALVAQEIDQVQARVASEQTLQLSEAEQAAQRAALAELRVSMAAVVSELPEIAARHQRLQAAIAQMKRVKYSVPMSASFLASIGAAADIVSSWVTSHDPQLLGLPPLPSAQDVAIAETKADIRRAQEMLETVRKIKTDWVIGADLSGDVAKLTDMWQRGLHENKRRLALLTGAADPGPYDEHKSRGIFQLANHLGVGLEEAEARVQEAEVQKAARVARLAGS